MATRDELLEALAVRYPEVGRAEKGRILSEFASVTGYHRKHAARVLQAMSRPDRTRPRPERRVYDDAVRDAPIPVLLATMERHGHLALDPQVRARLEMIKASTVDRLLAPARRGGSGRRRVARSPPIRRSVPIRTCADWDDPASWRPILWRRADR
jgi:hypothetical protein